MSAASYEWCWCGYREANIDGYRYILFGSNCRSFGLMNHHEQYISLDEREAHLHELLRKLPWITATLPIYDRN